MPYTGCMSTLYDQINELRRGAYEAACSEAEDGAQWPPLSDLDDQDWSDDGTLGDPSQDWCVNIQPGTDVVQVFAAGLVEAAAVIPGTSDLTPPRLTSAEFSAWVRALHMDLAQAAVELGVSHNSARHWSAGTKPIPYAVLSELQAIDDEISADARAALEEGLVLLPVGDRHAARVAARALIYANAENRRVKVEPVASTWLIDDGDKVPIRFSVEGKPSATDMARLIYGDLEKAWFEPREAWLLEPSEATTLLVKTVTGLAQHQVTRTSTHD